VTASSFSFAGKWRLPCLERQKLAVKFFKGFVIEACADMSDVMPGVFFAHGENERTEKRARPFGRWKTRNDDFLAFQARKNMANRRTGDNISGSI
jgi:hypothetical protein